MTIAKNNSKKFFMIIVMVSLALVCFYVFQVVKLTESGYIKGERETAIKELKKEVAELKLSVSKDRNLINIEEKVLGAGFEKVSKLNYIVVPEATVASK
jgi:hypothetical protein